MRGGNKMLTHSEGSFKKDICNPSFTAAAEKFKILSDQGRIRVIWSLHLNQECCVSDLAKILSIHTSALSHQLRVLRHAKIIKGRRIGKQIRQWSI